ncbi:predicted protein [Histoplasma mississippiense (nom. inval.)]|uniref:predicted protein n=1 Tax=Ajellomyces capsulatus (strain NAm1 / WU24) TaxID=2059318 RepID=UPI000157D53B|nr:predicted protein [Histoplasma mississippiense (nom. inval.)]EDN05414.1 predicted protein [Histoplasma mississippiense (nom. inval.)]
MAKAERLEDACDVREMRLTADEMKYLEEPVSSHAIPKSWLPHLQAAAREVGRQKRPRGPNVRARIVSRTRDGQRSSNPHQKTDGRPGSSETLVQHPEPRNSVSLTLSTPIEEQALNYYYHNYLEMEHLLPDLADSHLKYVAAGRCFAEPHSILSLAIFAVSHITFGRARKCQTSLTAGTKHYSKALVKTNLALQNASHVTDDEVLQAIMLLSFYENSVVDKGSIPDSSQAIQTWTSRNFAHHDGALAVLKLRRQAPQRTNHALVLDKLVRRQLMRSLLLRSSPLPPWLEDGFEYGERGFALELDTCLVEVAKIRHRAKVLLADSASNPSSSSSSSEGECGQEAALHILLEEAFAVDTKLLRWTDNTPLENWYTTHTVKNYGGAEIHSRVFSRTVHVYPTVGHAGMWNRYRALRLAVSDIVLQTLSVPDGLTGPDDTTEALLDAVTLTIEQLSNDICASVPYMLGPSRFIQENCKSYYSRDSLLAASNSGNDVRDA